VFEKFGAVIPAFNAAEKLVPVLEGVKKYLSPDRIVVVDDGSADETATLAEGQGVRVIREPINKGKGNALRTGFDHLLSLSDIEAIFTLDADGQHDPEEIPSFVDAYGHQSVDILIGNRMGRTEGMPPLRVMTNRVTSAIVKWRTGYRIEDSQSGYRLIRSSLISRLNLVTSRYETESEIIIKASRVGAVISSIPIRTIYAGEKSKINPFHDTLRFLMLVIRSLFW